MAEKAVEAKKPAAPPPKQAQNAVPDISRLIADAQKWNDGQHHQQGWAGVGIAQPAVYGMSGPAVNYVGSVSGTTSFNASSLTVGR